MSVFGRLLDRIGTRLYGPLPAGRRSTVERVPDPEIDALVAPWRTDDAAARARWEIHNRRAREAGCPCGQPGTHVDREPLGNGAFHEVWRCAEHVGVESWTGDADGRWQPKWTRTSPCGSCTGHCSTMSRIGAERPEKWFCPTKPDESVSE